jgi:hypothetical protein
MKNRTPPVWLALAAAVMLVAFSVGNAMGADPADEDPNHGQQVSDFVHTLLFGDDPPEDEGTTDETGAEDEEVADEETTDEESADGPPDNHGQCVRVVATGAETGGPNDNHGGTVNEAARVTCWEDGEGDEEGSEDESAEPTGASQRGNSANARDKQNRGKGNPHND